MPDSIAIEEATGKRLAMFRLAGTLSIVLGAVLLIAALCASGAVASDQGPEPPEEDAKPRVAADAARAALKKAELERQKVLEKLKREAQAGPQPKPAPTSLLEVVKDALEHEERQRRQAEAARRMKEVELQRRLFELQRAAAMRGIHAPRGFGIYPNWPGSADVEPGDLLKTDAELDRLLERADEFAQQGRSDLAVVVWQEVLSRSADTVMTREDWLSRTTKHEYRIYRSVSEEIERSLAELPAAGLRVYRASADGEAKSILAAGEAEHDNRGDPPGTPTRATPSNRREQALAEVVRRFFLSSYGDDAAFELACLKMERREFVGANCLLNKVLRRYPDSSIPRRQILSRLAVANARVGDQPTAREVLAELEESTSGDFKHLSLIRRDVERPHAETAAEASRSMGWRMRLGNPSRTGHMEALPLQPSQSPLTEFWSKELGIELAAFPRKQATPAARATFGPLADAPRRVVRMDNGGFVVLEVHNAVRFGGRLGGRVNRQTAKAATATPAVMSERWKMSGWNPAGALLLDRDRAYFKDKDRLVCCDTTTGETIWTGRPNRHQLDLLSEFYAGMFSAGVTMNLPSEQPASASEIALFGDRVRQCMSIAGNLILNVEGKLLEAAATTRANLDASALLQFDPGAPFETSANWLAAYEAKSGKLKWHRGPEDRQGDLETGGSFLAAPIPHANLLLAPVTDGGQLWVYGMAAEDGKTVWKTFLCEEPPDGRPRWSPVGIAAAGGDLYVASGAGAVFALDALSGTLRWVTTYPRAKQVPSPLVPSGFPVVRVAPGLMGFGENVVIPNGRLLLLIASDHDHLAAFDRRTGELLWESPVKPSDDGGPARYCLGVVRDSLYVAGKNNVRQYDLPSGRLVWDTEIDDSLGRGALTQTAIYLPLVDSILQLDARTGAKQRQIPVVLASEEPVGNLYCDGECLLVVGMGRVCALGESATYLEELAKLIEQGSGRAQLTRMRLRVRFGDTDNAVQDLRGAYDLLLEDEGPASANDALWEALAEQELAAARPLESLELLAKSATAASQRPQTETEVDGSEVLSHVLKSLAAAAGGDLPASEPPTRTKAESKRSEALYRSLKSVSEKELKGAAPLVLRVASLCTERFLLTAAQRAIAATVRPEDESLLRDSLASTDASVRAVGAAGLAACLRRRPAAELKQMLPSDDDHVRLAAAVALANQGDRAALPTLGDLLTSPEPEVRSRSVQVLRALTGTHFSYSPYGPLDRRSQAAAQWQAWIQSEAGTAELSYPIDETNLMSGKTLITSYLNGRVIEIDSRGQETWQAGLPGAWECQALADGHRLVCSCTHPVVVEYDAWGDEVWSVGLAGKPLSIQRLANGNTLVACYEGRIQEIKPDKTIAWEVALGRSAVDADRLENGNTLICLKSANRVVEIDRSGDVVWELADLSDLRSAERLPNGNTLVCHAGRSGVFEVDRDGKVVWRASDLRDPRDAQRLPNGNTLIADSRGLREIDPGGAVVWQWREVDVTRFSRFIPRGQSERRGDPGGVVAAPARSGGS